MAADDFSLEQAAKFTGGKGIETAGGLVEEENFGAVQNGTGKPEPVGDSGGQHADGAIELIGNAHPIGNAGDAGGRLRSGKIIHRSEEGEIGAGREAAVEALVAAGVVSQLLTGASAFALHVEAAKHGAATRGADQSGEDSKESGFSGAIGADEGNRFAALDAKGQASEGALSGAGDRKEKRTPTGKRRREEFLDVFDLDSRNGHHPRL